MSFTDNSIYKYRSTTSQIEIKVEDTEAKENIADITAGNRYYFFDDDKITDGVYQSPCYASLEENCFYLDGSRQLVNTNLANLYYGWWTNNADSTGVYSPRPRLEVAVGSATSSIGLTLHWDEHSYPLEVYVVWYDSDNTTVIKSGTYTNSSPTQVINEVVSNYYKVVIYISKARPNCACRLIELDFGLSETFTGEQIASASITEQTSLISNQIVSNSISFSIIDFARKYHELNPTQLVKYYGKGQKIVAKAGVQDRTTGEFEYVDMGTFYVESVNNSDGMLNITGYGILNKLNSEYFCSPKYTNETASNILQYILGSDVSHTMDSTAGALTLTGYIPHQSKKGALQVLAIATNCVIKENRDGSISLIRPTTVPSTIHTITRAQRLSEIETSQIGFYYKATAQKYGMSTSSGTSETIFDDDVQTDIYGDAVIEYGAPYHDVTITLESSEYSATQYADCCVITGNVNDTTSVTITGTPYTIKKTSFSKYASSNPYNEDKLAITIDSCNELVGKSSTANSIATWWLQQLAKRLTLSFDWWAVATTTPTDYVKVVTDFNEEKTIQITKIEYDLSTLNARVEGVL